jgi:cystathionine gamma-lyase
MHAAGTRYVHVGSEPDATTGAVVVPISLGTTFAQSSPGIARAVDAPDSLGRGFEYGRTGNPTRGAFERAMASAEGAAGAVAFASGLAATVAILHTLATGDHVVCTADVYGGTQRFFNRIAAPTYGMTFSFVDTSVPGALAAELAAQPRAKLVWLESPTNPTLSVSDIRACAAAAHAAGARLVVDNTFMSPYFQNPLALGADFCLHSVTKYINGHSDVVGGVVAADDAAALARLRFLQNSLGGVPSPFDCYLALRGLKTLHLRMERHAANAAAVAAHLEAHPAVERVLYPGLPSHPQHAVHAAQARGASGMITFYVRGGALAARVFLQSLALFTCAESLGAVRRRADGARRARRAVRLAAIASLLRAARCGAARRAARASSRIPLPPPAAQVESLAESPYLMTHASVPLEVRAKLGISESLVRLSIGVEDVADLIADLDAALAKSQAAHAAGA